MSHRAHGSRPNGPVVGDSRVVKDLTHTSLSCGIALSARGWQSETHLAQLKSPPILSPLAENKDLVTWRLAVKPLKQCGNHASSVGQNQLSVKFYNGTSDRFLLRPIGNGLNNVYLQLHPQLPLLCPPLLNFNHLEWSTIQKLQSYNSSTTRPNYSLGKPSNDRFKIQLTPGADRPSLFILRLPEIGGWL